MQKSKKQKNSLDLSDYSLSEQEKKMKKLGSKFCPTPKMIDSYKLMTDLQPSVTLTGVLSWEV